MENASVQKCLESRNDRWNRRKDFSILFQRDLLFVRKFFAHQLAAAFDDLGYETTVCEFTSQDDLDAVLSPFFGKKYRAVFDFNSLLPRLAMDDGTPVID